MLNFKRKFQTDQEYDNEDFTEVWNKIDAADVAWFAERMENNFPKECKQIKDALKNMKGGVQK